MSGLISFLITLIDKLEGSLLFLFNVWVSIYPDLNLFFEKKKITGYYLSNVLDAIFRL